MFYKAWVLLNNVCISGIRSYLHSDYFLYFCCYHHNVSTDVLSGFLQVTVDPVSNESKAVLPNPGIQLTITMLPNSLNTYCILKK